MLSLGRDFIFMAAILPISEKGLPSFEPALYVF